MNRLACPWDGKFLEDAVPFGPQHCLFSEVRGTLPNGADLPRGTEHAEVMRGTWRNAEEIRLLIHPYPRRERARQPCRAGFPVRPAPGKKPGDDSEHEAQDLNRRMNEVVARVQELEEALDDAEHVWPRLRSAWRHAEDESDPRMAEIVYQARELRPCLRDLERRIRKILRRSRERVPLGRVQEMDRAAMRWLARQPGRNVAERAGSDQRILATVRQENHDTPENRVLHAYVSLAANVARGWLLDHPHASASPKFMDVKVFRDTCQRFARNLKDLGVGISQAGVQPNYVLMQDPAYRQAYGAWLRLLKRHRAIDDLWAWQMQTWTDFAVLAIVLALDEMEESQLIAQSPIIWRDEAIQGRWFEQDRPIAVFWLRNTHRIVEVQARPVNPSTLLLCARAHVALRVTDPDPDRPDLPRRIAVWTPHSMKRIDPEMAAKGACKRLDDLQGLPTSGEILRDGLILTPAHGSPGGARKEGRERKNRTKTRVEAIAFDASGKSLRDGMAALRDFAKSDIYREPVR